MASDYRIISPFAGTTIYLVNSSGAPTSGGAATAAATTPWAIRFEDWTPQAAPPAVQWSGGPPFSFGSLPAYQGYANKTETIPLMLIGGTHDTMIARLQQLRQSVARATAEAPAILMCQPSGSTNAVYFEILSANAQERRPPNSTSPGEGASKVWVDLQLTLSPLGGLLSSGEVLLNASSYTNNGSGGANTKSLSTGSGDLIYEGGPLNIKVLPTTAGSDPATLYLATVASNTYATTSAGSSTTSSSTQTAYGATTTFDISALLTDARLKCRVMGRFSAVSSNARVAVTYGFPLMAGNWSTTEIDPANLATLVDFGPLPIPTYNRSSVVSTYSVMITPTARSTNGSAVAVTLTSLELLLYYDFCTVTQPSGSDIDASSSQYWYIDAAPNKTNVAVLPRQAPTGAIYASTGTPVAPSLIRGTAPRYYSGCKLYAGWTDVTGLHTTTWAATVTATHAPLYRSLRGAG